MGSNSRTEDLVLDKVKIICCIGAGRAGVLSMLVLASRWPEKTFVVLDRDAEIIQQMNANPIEMPFSEPGMTALLDACPNLIFSNDIEHWINESRLIFIAVHIPLMTKPKQLKGNLDIINLETAFQVIHQSALSTHLSKFVAIKSTLPVDFEHHIRILLAEYEQSQLLHLITNPEFFSEGTAIQDLLNPPRVIMGRFFNENENTFVLFNQLYLRVVDNDMDRIVVIGRLSSVEIGKLLANALLAAQLCVINAGTSICDRIADTNFDDVRATILANPRINQNFLDSKSGYGGLGLTKDVSYLAFLCQCIGLTEQKRFFNQLNEMREEDGRTCEKDFAGNGIWKNY